MDGPVRRLCGRLGRLRAKSAKSRCRPASPRGDRNPGQESAGPAASEAQAGTNAAISDADRKLIEKQKVCPVSGEPLGSMGEAVKVVVKGRTVFLCCEGCKEALMADPDKYLKKLDEKK